MTINARRTIWTPCKSVFVSAFMISLTVVSVVMYGATVFAQTLYVKPSSEVPVRTGQGTGYKIIAVLQDGVRVDVVEEDGAWVKIRTVSGREGWMLRRYLSSDLPLKKVVASLKMQKAQIEKRGAEIYQKLNDVSASYARSQKELNACIEERDKIRESFQALQEDATNVVHIKKALADTVKELEQMRKRQAAIEQENKYLKKNNAVKWFLAGGGVLIVGWIIGLMTGRSRKKKPSLL
ncbi:MAG TPA: TIGR04211 family SH3 domain-containing protein [Thermodesulfobacteriaceae bacterium]|nr:TIGR04211 family SH3 domain-containing protein [Thermodesulfobacteriaceae bacterium]